MNLASLPFATFHSGSHIALLLDVLMSPQIVESAPAGRAAVSNFLKPHWHQYKHCIMLAQPCDRSLSRTCWQVGIVCFREPVGFLNVSYARESMFTFCLLVRACFRSTLEPCILFLVPYLIRASTLHYLSLSSFSLSHARGSNLIFLFAHSPFEA